jgi:hypothetical protein
MSRHRQHAGELSSAVDHFVKVSRSYWSGLFPCCDVPDLPRTNNALEQLFGSDRYHERRITGRKTASPQRGREVSQLNLQYFGEELIVPSGALPLSFQAVRGGMML